MKLCYYTGGQNDAIIYVRALKLFQKRISSDILEWSVTDLRKARGFDRQKWQSMNR